tara:strand:+ start:5539 stop:5892 length:354 start_codon:yes stop_codon:yes gene_type:complete
MSKPTLPSTPRSNGATSSGKFARSSHRVKRNKRSSQNSDVLISAVISSYLLTHLHHVLQRAEYGATQEGRDSQASNFAQLRKVLCMDARSMEDASAVGMTDSDFDKFQDSNLEPKVA